MAPHTASAVEFQEEPEDDVLEPMASYHNVVASGASLVQLRNTLGGSCGSIVYQ